LKQYINAVYKGELIDNDREGMGVMIYGNSDRIYEGFWKADLRHGIGYERYKNGNKYEGEFKENKADGKGVYYWLNGERYDG
jgi:hypothetical protein